MHTHTLTHTHTHTLKHTEAHTHTCWHAIHFYFCSFAQEGVPATYTSNYWTMHTKTSHFQVTVNHSPRNIIYNHIILHNNTAPVASHSLPNIPPVYPTLIVPASPFQDTFFIFMMVLENMFYHINYCVTTK